MRPAARRKTGLRQARRLVQLVTLGLWLTLFAATRGRPELALPPDLFLITDPLLAALALGAARVAVPAMAFSLLLVGATLVLGRFFCGWLCPLGTLIDGAAKLLHPPAARFSAARHAAMQTWKYLLLALFAAGALASAQWIYLLDPLVLLFRATSGALLPALGALLPPGALPAPWAAEDHGLAVLPVLLLVVVLGLTALAPRFYCRYLCPLGALYGLLSRWPLLRRRVDGCDGCVAVQAEHQCVGGCRMGAVPERRPLRTLNHECIRCFSGRSLCHAGAIHFDWSLGPAGRWDVPLDLERRALLVAGATGAGLLPLASLAAYHRADPNRVIRPPRVLDEGLFVDQCVRCSMCVQACPTQTLQPTHLEAGVAAIWTPAITPLAGGCVAECNACGLVCPTDAIPSFGKAEADKWAVKMGTAVFESGRCISYTERLPCAKCLEVCPTKAFVIEAASEARPRRPAAIDALRCVGCGLCEQACDRIVFGVPALLTFAHGRGQPTSLAEAPSASFASPER